MRTSDLPPPVVGLGGHSTRGLRMATISVRRAYNAWLKRRGLEDREPAFAKAQRLGNKRRAERRAAARAEYLAKVEEFLHEDE